MIIDILNNIIKYCRLERQIDVHNINTYTTQNIYIYNLSLLGYHNFTQKTLCQRKYSKLMILLCPNNKNITDVNHLKDTLIELDCSGRKNGICQDGIAKLASLKILDCSFNKQCWTLGRITGRIILRL